MHVEYQSTKINCRFCARTELAFFCTELRLRWILPRLVAKHQNETLLKSSLEVKNLCMRKISLAVKANSFVSIFLFSLPFHLVVLRGVRSHANCNHVFFIFQGTLRTSNNDLRKMVVLFKKRLDESRASNDSLNSLNQVFHNS